jgi:hypothetical protein
MAMVTTQEYSVKNSMMASTRRPLGRRTLIRVFGVLCAGASLFSLTSCQSDRSSRPSGDRVSIGSGSGGGPGGDQGMPPNGPPPDGGSGGGPGMQQGNGGSGSQQPGQTLGQGNPPDGQGRGSSNGPSSFSGIFSQKGGIMTLAGKSFSTDRIDTSGVVVANGGTLVARDLSISTGGKSSSLENSSFYGLDSGILATGGSTIVLSGSGVETRGDGATGVFATGEGTVVVMKGGSIATGGAGAHAAMADLGGSLILTDVDMKTDGANSAAVATGRDGGSILMEGGSVVASGKDSPGIHSTGTVSAFDTKISASGSEAAVIEGAGTIDLRDTVLSTSFADGCGVMICQSKQENASGKDGRFIMSGGALSSASVSQPLFRVTNSIGVIDLSRVDVSAASGILLKAEAGSSGRGNAGGGNAVLVCDGQVLSGYLSADRLSSISVTLDNRSVWTGAVNSAKTAKSISVALDAASVWRVTADSFITVLSEPDGLSGSTIGNIVGNGHTVYYRASANAWLGGRTYPLPEGGTLTPY